MIIEPSAVAFLPATIIVQAFEHDVNIKNNTMNVEIKRVFMIRYLKVLKLKMAVNLNIFKRLFI